VGGAAAIIPWVLGLVAIGPIVARMGEVSGAVAAGGGPPSPEQAAEMQALGRRARSLGWVNIILLLIAVVAMAAARVAERRRQHVLDLPPQLRGRFPRVEDHVSALDLGRDVPATVILESGLQRCHPDEVPAPHVDPAQERHVSGHEVIRL
jgi:hypothetical protein